MHTALDLEALLRLEARRAARQRAWALFLERHPIVVCPSSAEPPLPYGLDVAGEAEMARILRAQAYSLATPLLGVPSVAVPTGLTADGLPMGVQVIAGRWREDLALDAAEVVEARGPMGTPVEPRV